MIKRFATVSAIPPLQARMTFWQYSAKGKGSPPKPFDGQAPLAASDVFAGRELQPILVGSPPVWAAALEQKRYATNRQAKPRVSARRSNRKVSRDRGARDAITCDTCLPHPRHIFISPSKLHERCKMLVLRCTQQARQCLEAFWVLGTGGEITTIHATITSVNNRLQFNCNR